MLSHDTYKIMRWGLSREGVLTIPTRNTGEIRQGSSRRKYHTSHIFRCNLYSECNDGNLRNLLSCD